MLGGPATGNELLLTVTSQDRGIKRMLVLADHLSRRFESTSHDIFTKTDMTEQDRENNRRLIFRVLHIKLIVLNLKVL